MKKIFSILFASVIALMAVSCYPDELAVFDTSKATAPVLGDYEVGEKAITADFTPGSFNQNFNKAVTPNHFFVITNVDNKVVSKAITTSNKDGQLSASITSINNALISMGYAEGDVVSLTMRIRASMQTNAGDNGRNGFVDSDGTIDIPSFEIIFPQGNPWAEYTQNSPWGLIGSIASTGNAWNADDPMYCTTDGTKHVARNVKLTPSDQFKVRKDGGWDTNFGAPGDTEPYVMTVGESIAATAGGKNLSVPAEGAYDLLLDEAAGTLTLYEAYLAYPGFDQASTWGVTGSIASEEINWDVDVTMTTDGEWHVAEGVVLTTGDQFKFRNDRSWNENLGAAGDVEPFVVTIDAEFDAVANGKNIAVPADGTYDLLVNPSAGLFKVVESLGGKSPVDRGEPGPEKPEAWSLIGTLSGSSWDKDFDLSNTSGDIWLIRNVAVTENDEFKIRADHDWGTNYGGPEANDHSTIDPGNPYDVYKPELGVTFPAGDKNIRIGKAGNYDVTFDYANLTILIEEHVAAFSLIGQINGTSWNVDVPMTEDNGVWTSPVVSIEGGFKIRYDYSWDDDKTYGAAEDGFVAPLGEPFTLAQPGKDIKLAEVGNYRVVFNPATKEVTIKAVAFPEQLYMIGEEFGGWDWNSNGVVEMIPVLHNPDWGAEAEGQFWTVRYFTAGKGFKFCSVRDWKGDFWGLTTNDGFVESGGNCTVTEDGFYLVHIDLKREMVHVEPARVYGIGDCFGGWDEAMEAALFKADGKQLKATAAAEGDVRMYVASSIATSAWWTREFVFFDGKIAYRGNGGDQERVKVLKGQEVSLDFNAGTAAVGGEGQQSELPTTMYMIGEAIGGWDWDASYIVNMTPVNTKAGQFWAIRNLEAGKGFKFCAQKAWSGDFNSLGTDTGYTVVEGNCVVAETGVYMIYVDTDNKKICVERAKVYGIGDCFGGWTEAMSGALFTESNGKLVGKTTAAGDIRIYAASSIATSDWWTREFVFFNGQIAYRGNGGDQERVTVEAGKTVTLDFNAGTATVE
ncbi:MAG: SusF/SusE family outer membrane protein [Bacteroidales bacterium]|nr:SusF/SusE family outer membrane protein [Bacteroidales bacterium]